MIALLQRVSSAQVTVDGSVCGSIGRGLLILLGIAGGDNEAEADKLIRKVAQLRIFSDENGKMNLSVKDIGGECLVVSQFTLLADCRKGNRPSFTGAGPPEEARRLYGFFREQLAVAGGLTVASGIFGADMKVSLVNDGPVTISLNSADFT